MLHTMAMSRQRQSGQGMVEVSVVIALISIAAILMLTLLGNTTYQVYSNVVCKVQGTVPSVFPNSPCGNQVSATPSPVLTDHRTPQDAPVAWWRLDESSGVANDNAAGNAKDEMNNDPGTYQSNSGTVTGGLAPALTNGSNLGTSVSFGGGSYMNAATLSALQGDHARSVEVWFNSARTNNAQPNYQNIFESGAVGSYNSMQITLIANTACCSQPVGGPTLAISFIGSYRPDFAPVTGIVYIPDMNLADAHWHYLVVTLSGSTLNVYVDGVQPMGSANGNATYSSQGPPALAAGTGFTLPFTPSTATSTFDFGGNVMGLGGAPFVGKLDEAAVYDKALSAVQVAAHYAADIGTPSVEASTAYSSTTLDGDSQNGCALSSAQILAGACGPQAYWRLGDTVNGATGPGSVATDTARGTFNDPNGDAGNYNGSEAYGPGAGTPVGVYSQNGGSSGTGSVNSSGLDAGNSTLTTGNNGCCAAATFNATGSGVRANTVSAMQGSNDRTIKLWFQAANATTFTTLNTNSPGTFSNVADVQTLLGTGADGFTLNLLSQAGADYLLADVGGSPAGSAGGIEVRMNHVSRAYAPASSDLRDGHWHYLVVSVSGNNVTVWIDNTQKSGYICCYSNAWSGVYSAPAPMVLSSTPNTATGDITLGYETGEGPVPGWFKGNLQDVAIFNYVLTPQQISHEWGKAHIGASCSNLVLANVSGNADGGVYSHSNGPVWATATQSCDTVGSLGLTGNASVPSDPSTVLADNYVTLYYGLEKHLGTYTAACYRNLSASSQISWISGVGPWVYCYPGGFPNPDPLGQISPTQRAHPYTVTMRVGPSASLHACNGSSFPGGQTVCFYQGEILTPCSVIDPHGYPDPLYFIEAQNAYAVANPIPNGAGIPLNATQTSQGLSPNLAESQNGAAMSPAWGISGPSTESFTVGQCVPAPGEQLSDMSRPAPQPMGGDSTPDGWATWAQLADPFILITPSTATVQANQQQAYTATAYQANGVAIGNVTASTALQASGIAFCNNTTHSCTSGSAGVYTVTGTYGTEQAVVTLTVVAATPYAQAVMADGPVAYWHLGEASGTTAADTSGNGNAGTYSAGVSLGASSLLTSGQESSNKAVAFNGTNSSVTIPASGSLNTAGNISIEAWIKPTSGNDGPLVEYNNGSTWGVHMWNTGPNQLYVNFLDSGGGGHTMQTGNVLSSGNTYYVVATYSNSTGLGTMYINGVQVAQSNLGSFTLQTSYNLYLGYRPNGGNRWTGTEDEVAIYNYALSHSQVANHYCLGNAACTLSLTPASSTHLPNQAVAYATSAVGPSGSLGNVTGVLSISPTNTGATCNQVNQTCQGVAVGSYTVSTAFGSASASATLVVSASALTYPQVVANDNPILYWRLGDSGGTSAADSSGNSYTGTLNGGVTEGASGAISGNTAMTLNGANGYVVTPQIASSFTGASQSLEIWVNTTSGGVVFDENNGGWHDSQVTVESNGQVRFRVWNCSPVDSGATTINNGSWHYVVLTYDRSSTTLAGYVDGVSVGSSASCTRQVPTDGHQNDARPTAQVFAIGQGDNANINNGTGAYFNGGVDEPAIYNYALSPAQVSTHYAAR